MGRKKKLINRLPKEWRHWLSLFILVTFGFFMWKVWDKLNTMLGDGNQTIIITGLIVLIGILLGVINWKDIEGRFK